jgi:hypothetical protein
LKKKKQERRKKGLCVVLFTAQIYIRERAGVVQRRVKREQFWHLPC